MIDGKICSALSNVSSSSQTCYICGAKPSEMNKQSLILMKHLDQTALPFGLSPLHSWIRFMEFCLDSFNNYAEETRNLYLREYSWYNMPVTVHKVLFHRRDVIASCILPIGQLPEEAQEARNKDNRRYREFFTRKTSRIDTNTDLLNRLLISSDPFISSFRLIMKRKRNPIDPEVLKLHPAPAVNETESEISD
ncbi:hypothetical protein ACJJTC_018692 [Scirpophaga incertulas]